MKKAIITGAGSGLGEPEVRPRPGMEDRGWGILKKREF